MATLKTYVKNLWAVERAVHKKLGGDELRLAPLNTRILILTLNVVVGVLLKVLTDKAVITDADLQTYYSTAAGLDYPVQPAYPPMEDEESGTTTIDPDMGV